METQEELVERFQAERPRLRGVAYRMLGSLSEADDAVQETWLRLSRTDTSGVENLGAWLTTVTGRLCLDMLRSRRSRREEPLDLHLPDPIISGTDGMDPEQQALLADSIGFALLVVLDTLTPAERLAFVLHDVFAVSFAEIAPIVGRSPGAAKQLASRARQRVRAAAPMPDTDLSRQREVVDAFLTAARGGDIDALLAVLAPDVVVRSDGGSTRPATVVRGASAVARQALTFARWAKDTKPATINGMAGAVAFAAAHPFSVMAFTITQGRISGIDIITDPDRLRGFDLTRLAT